MNKIILLLSIILLTNGCSLDKNLITTQEATSEIEVNNSLKNISPIYLKSIKEAISKVAPNKDLNSIEFTPLLGGLSKAVLLTFKANGKQYVLRLLDKSLEIRKSEIVAHKIADNLGVAPKIFYIDSEENPLVIMMEFIDGRDFTAKDLNNKKLLKKTMDVIRKFNNCNKKNIISHKVKLDLYDDLYNRMLKSGSVYPSGFEEMRKKLRKDYEKLSRTHLPTHGDFIPWNILITKDEKVYLIDWPNTRLDNPFVDIGSFAYIAGASKEQIKNMLKAYLLRRPTKSEIDEVMFFQSVELFLFAIWMIGIQEEKDQKKLDSILSKTTKKFSEHLRDGVKDRIKGMKGLELTELSLSMFKELKENMQVHK